jgi:hypothetical protein
MPARSLLDFCDMPALTLPPDCGAAPNADMLLILPPTPRARKPAQPFCTAEPACPNTFCADDGRRCCALSNADGADGAEEDKVADDSEREKPEVDPAFAVHAARRPRMLPMLSREGSGGDAGEYAGRPWPSPSLLLLGPAVALADLPVVSGGSICPALSARLPTVLV